MNELMNEIRACAKKNTIDLIGFAPKSRFDALPAEKNPFSVFPEGETVILLGKRICRGSLRGVEEGTNFGDYALFGKSWLEDEFLSLACYELTNVLEDHGWEAVPLFPNPTDMAPTGIPVAPGRPAPNVFPDFDYAAVACGLCEISYSGLPFSPEFGSRQRFQMIVTDAALDATPLLDAEVCLHCGKCASACPLGAISLSENEDITVCGKTMRVAKIDFDRCRVCKNGALPNKLVPTARPDRVAALCNRTCMNELPVKNVFENPFRTRETWAIGGQKSSYERDTEAANVLGGSFSKTGKR